MRTLLAGALVANLAGCSHQPPPVQTAADSCASRNRLACFLSVRVSLRPTSLTTTSAKLESKQAIARKARETALSLGTPKQGTRADVKDADGKSRHSSLVAARQKIAGRAD
jgi:hypothetical protein